MRWMAWAVALLVLVSLAGEWLGGRARLRGVGTFLRTDDPGRFWLVLGVKTLILLALVAFALWGPPP